MAKGKGFSKSKPKNKIQDKLENKKPSKHDSFFNYTTRQLDINQGQRFEEWQKEGLLGKLMEHLRGMEQSPISNHKDTKMLHTYPSWPPDKKTEYHFPKHISPDAVWARIKIQGSVVVVGHIVRDVFNIVFLDKEHKWYKVDKKHT
jgi:hypothetical protein